MYNVSKAYKSVKDLTWNLIWSNMYIILYDKEVRIMSGSTSGIPGKDVIRVEGNSLAIRIGEYMLTLKIEGPEAKPSGRLQLGHGRTLFDLVLNAARTYAKDTGDSEFSAADLYHLAVKMNPDVSIRRNSWNSHVVSCAPNHPSYRHYTSHRDYFRYLDKGRYSLHPSLLPQNYVSRDR